MHMQSNGGGVPATAFHPSALPPQQANAMVQVAASKAVAEVQAALTIAKRFPRDMNRAYTRIMQACERISLAEQALYAYKRGDDLVEGPSIRLAEMLAQCWENLDFGVREIEQRDGYSVCQSYCWDMETNVRQTKEFTVPHKRYLKGGKVKQLTDPRDIYELVANYGARRLRACILGVIPGDIVEAAVTKVKETLEKGTGEPLADRIRKMVAAFAGIGVTQGMIEKRLGHKLEATTAAELVQLQAVYKSIRDGFSSASEYFEMPTVASDEKSEQINEALGIHAEGAAPAGETQNAGAQPQPQQQQAEQDAVITPEQLADLRQRLHECGIDEKMFARFCRVTKLELLPQRKLAPALAEIDKRAKQKKQEEPQQPAKTNADSN